MNICICLQEESEDWSAAAVLLLEGCNRLARQEMSKVHMRPMHVHP